MKEQLALLPGYLTAHLQLSLLALLLGFALSLPAGVWAAKRRRAEQAVLGAAGVLQTIPSLALLAAMVPALALLAGLTQSLFGVPLPSIGFLPALLALTLYSLLPMLRNTVTGLTGVDPALVEAARAVGMTPRQRLLRVELPLAAPVIVAGVRTATVWVVGTATLSTPVGAPSLGNYIFGGLQTRNFQAVLVGCAAAALLALSLDQIVRLLELGVAQRRKGLAAACLALLVALGAFAGGTLLAEGLGGRAGRQVTIGAKTFTEQYVLSEILARTLESRTGVGTRTVHSLGSTVAFDALRAGEIDLYVDYTGTLWTTVLKRGPARASRGELLQRVADHLEVEHGIELVAALGFENAYALGMREKQAARLGVRTIGQLSAVAPKLEMGADYEFFARDEWRALRSEYGLRFRAERTMDPSLMYQAVEEGAVDVISAYTTDGRVAALDLRLLEDERGVIPPYDAVILAGTRIRRELPAAIAALRELEGAIDAETMRRLNLAVDRDRRSPAAVAEEWWSTTGE